MFDYAWILLIFTTTINAYYLKARSQKYISAHPELQEGYDKLFKGYLIYLNIPWVIIGLGMIFGKVPDFLSFFEPREGNPFVLIFHAAFVILLLLSVWWIYFRGGAEFLVKHPGIFRRELQSPTTVKVFYAVALAGSVFAMIRMWSQ
ncbi:MAG: hypothetical protein GY796_08035 [Chloroflexi bacterium]|nr:hypothetical protein [Chloroflexota bacterium]